MKVAIFISEIIWSSHLGTGLEIIQRELDTKSEVFAFVCNGFLERCDQNLDASDAICSICVNKRKKGFSLLTNKVNYIPIEFERKDFNYLNPETSLQSFLQIRHKEFDLGLAVASSLISRYRDAHISIKDNYDYFKDITNNAASLYDFFIEKLTELKLEKVYVFNGRFDYDRALLRACETLNIDYYIYDGAMPLNKFMLVKNSMIHDIETYHTRVYETWEESKLSVEEKRKIGEGFYLDRRYGSKLSRVHFVKNQIEEILPESWNSDIINITAFLTSEDEFVAIGPQWEMVVYKNQLEGLRKISKSLKSTNNTIKLYIRIHPNTYNTSPLFVKEVHELESDHIEVIPPDSPISSYSMLLASSKVISFGSTMGIEATYWGIPSILLGKSLYMHMNAGYSCVNHEEAMKLILDDNLKAIQSENVYKYGFYHVEFGIFYKYYESLGHGIGNYRGYNLRKLNQTKFVRFKEEVKKFFPKAILNFYTKMINVS